MERGDTLEFGWVSNGRIKEHDNHDKHDSYPHSNPL